MYTIEICRRIPVCIKQYKPENNCYYPCEYRRQTAKEITNLTKTDLFTEQAKVNLQNRADFICPFHADSGYCANQCPNIALSDRIIETFETDDDIWLYEFPYSDRILQISTPDKKVLKGDANDFLVYLDINGNRIIDNTQSQAEQQLCSRITHYPVSEAPYDNALDDIIIKDSTTETFAAATESQIEWANKHIPVTPSYPDFKFDAVPDGEVAKTLTQTLSDPDTAVSANTADLVNTPATPPPTFTPASQAGLPAAPPNNTPKVQQTNVVDYFQNPSSFGMDLATFIKYKDRKTGFSNLDSVQPLYPGLITIGAVPSLGKTTFCCQLVENLAIAGEHILYFSLEQTPFELLTKSVARRTYKAHMNDTLTPHKGVPSPCYTSIQIRRGDFLETDDTKAYVFSHIQRYCDEVGNRLTVVNSPFSLTVEGIRQTVEAYIQKHGVVPVIVIDYLQIVAATMENNRTPDTRTSIDHIVHELKILQQQYQMTVFLISALNRQNFMNTIDMESFKESSGIEYTSDMIIGLELEILSREELFNTDASKKISQKRLLVQIAKARNPRHIAMVVLKNRFGVSTYRANFEYYPAYDFFLPCGIPNAKDLIGDLSILDDNKKDGKE